VLPSAPLLLLLLLLLLHQLQVVPLVVGVEG
jgi:hypothetical protein